MENIKLEGSTSQSKRIIFHAGSSITEKSILELHDNGDIFVKGKLIENDKEVVDALRELINNSKAELFDKAIKHVQNNYCETYIDIPYLLIGDVAELIKITTGKEVDLETLIKLE